MMPRTRLHTKKFYRYALFFILLVASVNCAMWDLVGEPVSNDVFAETYTAISREQTQIQREIEEVFAQDTAWADINNAEATRLAAQSQTARAASKTSPPTILSVEFPSTIPGNKETFNGKLFFQDPDGDVVRIKIDVVHAIQFGSADYDPRPYLISGDTRNGVYQLFVWCEGAQEVMLQTRLQDAAGNWSNSRSFQFTCE